MVTREDASVLLQSAAAEIAQSIGWSVVNDDVDPLTKSQIEITDGTQRARIAFGHPYTILNVRGLLPRDDKQGKFASHITDPSIGITYSRGIGAIIKDVQRRFLPALAEAMKAAVATIAERNKQIDLTDRTAAAVLKVAGRGAKRNGETVHLGTPFAHGRLRISGENVTIDEMFDLTASEVVAALEAVLAVKRRPGR